MPLYNFECKNCDAEFEILTAWDKSGEYLNVFCPECGSKKKQILIALTSFRFGNPVGTGVWNNGSTGHDYRHQWNVDRPGGVRDQRKNAEEKSHMGSTPYTDTTAADFDLDGRIQ